METLNGKKTKGFITQISHWSDFLTDKRVGWLLRGGAWVKETLKTVSESFAVCRVGNFSFALT